MERNDGGGTHFDVLDPLDGEAAAPESATTAAQRRELLRQRTRLDKALRRLEPRLLWQWKGDSLEGPEPVRPDCKICGVGELERRTLYRTNGALFAIGWVLFVLPAGVGLSLLLATAAQSARDAAEAGRAHSTGEAAAWLLWGGTLLGTAAAMLLWGVIGLLLAMRKRVLQCTTCGSVTPRS